MHRLYLQLIALPLVLFATVMLLIRVQPYDSADLHAVLIPADCQMPCFMGIRPGVTTDAEAVKRLQASGWAQSITRLTNSDYDLIQWGWNGKQPAWIDPQISPSLKTEKRVVMSISVNTRAALGDLELSFGRASQNIALLTDTGSGAWLQYVAYYPQVGVVLSANTLCQLHKTLNADTLIVYYDTASFPTDTDNPSPKSIYSLCES